MNDLADKPVDVSDLFAGLPPDELEVARRLRSLIVSWAEGVEWLRQSLQSEADLPKYVFAVEDYAATLGSRSSLERALESVASWDSELGRRVQKEIDAVFRALTETDDRGLLEQLHLGFGPGWGGWWSDRVPRRGAVRAHLEQRASDAHNS